MCRLSCPDDESFPNVCKCDCAGAPVDGRTIPRFDLSIATSTNTGIKATTGVDSKELQNLLIAATNWDVQIDSDVLDASVPADEWSGRSRKRSRHSRRMSV